MYKHHIDKMMNLNTTAAVIEQNTYINDSKIYRVAVLKVLGGIQIGLGILCVLLIIISLIIHGRHEAVVAFEVPCLFLSGWFILTGTFPFCMKNNKRKNWRCMKLTFMILSILGAVLFSPAISIIEGILIIVKVLLRENGVINLVISVVSLVEFIIAIVSSSFCCCCSPGIDELQTTKIVYAVNPQDIPPPPYSEDVPQQRAPQLNRDQPIMAVLPYEEPVTHAALYDEIADRYYESLGDERQAVNQYQRLTDDTQVNRARYEGLGTQDLPSRYTELHDQTSNDKSSYEKLGAKSSLNKYEHLNKQEKERASYLELTDNTPSATNVTIAKNDTNTT